jgi:hypothetical protein
MIEDERKLVLVKFYLDAKENLKQVQAYLTIELGHEVTQPEALAYLIDEFLAKKGNAPKENGSPHLESPEVPYP